MSERQKQMITAALLYLIIFIVVFSTVSLVRAASDAFFGSNPRLVGYDCRGAGGPLYADEEDHFPAPCRAIETR